MADLSVEICGLHFASPLMPAAGPPVRDGAACVAAVKGGAGAIVSKTVSVEPAQVPRPCSVAAAVPAAAVPAAAAVSGATISGPGSALPAPPPGASRTGFRSPVSGFPRTSSALTLLTGNASVAP